MKFKSWGIKMILFGDYHTHTQYSHGKGTILDNAKVAESKGLKEIAITDHGFGHQLYGVKRQDVENILRDIKKAEKETGVNILYGVEGNFVDRQGNIDVTADDYSKMDILLVGHHNFVRSTRFSDKFPMFYRNMLSGIWAVFALAPAIGRFMKGVSLLFFNVHGKTRDVMMQDLARIRAAKIIDTEPSESAEQA